MQEHIVVDGYAEENANEAELLLGLECARREPVVQRLLVINKEGFKIIQGLIK